MSLILRDVSAVALLIFDRLLFFLDRFVNSGPMQLFGALFFVGSLAISASLFVYWGYCATTILAAAEAELTEEQMDEMRWSKRFRERFLQIFLFGPLALH